MVVESLWDGQVFCSFIPPGKPESCVTGDLPMDSDLCPILVGRSEHRRHLFKLHGYGRLVHIERCLVVIFSKQGQQCCLPIFSPQTPSNSCHQEKYPTKVGCEPSTSHTPVSESRENVVRSSSISDLENLPANAVDAMMVDSDGPEFFASAESTSFGLYGILDSTPKSHFTQSSFRTSTSTLRFETKKRAGNHLSQQVDHHGSSYFKRPRNRPPHSVRKEATKMLQQRKRKRAEDTARRLLARKEQRDRKFMQDIMADIPQSNQSAEATCQEHQGQPPASASDNALDEDSERLNASEDVAHAAFAEPSRQNLTPSSVHKSRDEELLEAAAELQRQQRRTDAENRAKDERQQAEARRRLAEKKRADAQEQRKRRQEKAGQERQQRVQGTWTMERALERYITLSNTFDSTIFSLANPLTFAAVPWPMLSSPLTLRSEDIDWTGVEQFFKFMKEHRTQQDYKMIVERSHRRFHPDRWCSRGLLHTVTDDTRRKDLEVAANTVAQALTPIWRDSKVH